MGLLSHEQFIATFREPMVRVAADEPPPFDFWPYVDSIQAGDFEGRDCSEGAVEYVWRDSSDRFAHVLINSEDPNVFMAVILDRHAGTVYGHRLLNLNHEYGLDG